MGKSLRESRGIHDNPPIQSIEEVDRRSGRLWAAGLSYLETDPHSTRDAEGKASVIGARASPAPGGCARV